jgi:hypothetical protein
MADDGVREDAAGALAAAAARLEAALKALERRVAETAARDADEEVDLFGGVARDAERERLAAALDAARAREKALEQVAAEASAALGRAADEVRAALSAEGS